MSIGTLTTIAVTRNVRPPTRADTGAAATANEPAGGGNAKLTDILVETVPTGLVTAYTAFITIVSQLVDDPTPQMPDPDKYAGWRWAGFAVLVVVAIGLTLMSYNKKKAQAEKRGPWLEVAAVAVATIGWGLAVPESPLLVDLDNKNGLLATAFIAFVAVVVNVALARQMKNEKPA